MVLMCVGSIELIWVEKYGKMGEKYTFSAFFGDLYWYSLGSGRFWPTCTGTGQSCTGIGNALFFYFDQFSYFSYNFLIYYPIRVIQGDN